ncbi:swr complex subunit [Ranunculus cassubicifolius]
MYPCLHDCHLRLKFFTYVIQLPKTFVISKIDDVIMTHHIKFYAYNKLHGRYSVDTIKYTEEEYEKHLIDPAWTKEETDQLFDLCERFDLRFVVIADRFPSPRSVEELKSRYYAVSRAIAVARAPSGDVPGNLLPKEAYNVQQEVERKRALSMVLSQTKQQERKDAEVLAEAKRITESRVVAKAAEEAELAASSSVILENNDRFPVPVDSVSPSSNSQLPVATVAPSTPESALIPSTLRMLRVYLRSNALEQMVQAASSSAGLRTIKRVDQTLLDLGVNIKPKVPTKAVCAEHLELRKEILTLLNLQKQLQYKEAEASGQQRDGSYIESPTTPKRMQRVDQQDRSFLPEAVNFSGGDRVGLKREQKRKAPGRYSDGPPSPTQSNKRPRKLKASD